ncbi:MAG: hypothetical protein PHF42_05200 [Pseudomonas sp.]|nr:hypothetical protein [Pseudomonas sp.]
METKHTPGPWKIDDLMTVYAPNKNGWNRFCAQVSAGRLIGENELRANVSLIAAAPELLAALQQTVAWMEGERTAIDALANARAIIAKATTPNAN